MGLNAALGIAGRALEVFSTGIQVAGQNIANANTPGYIRENLLIGTSPSYRSGEIVLGTGVQVQGVVQQVDQFLQVRIHAANSDFSAADARNSIYAELQAQLKELGDNDLSTQISNFLAAMNNVANQPESVAFRQQAVEQGTQLASYIGTMRDRIDQQRQTQDIAVQQQVDKANTLIRQIVDLNPKISKLEASGLLNSQAGALRDQRYQALNELSQIIPIRYQERGDGSVDVFTNSDFLILTGKYQQLEPEASGDRNVAVSNVRLSITHSEINAGTSGGGSLRGIFQGRDNVLGGFIDNLDKLAANLIVELNKIHASGQGLEGFTSVTSADRVADPTVALNQAELPFLPQHGSFQIVTTNKLSGLATTSTINVDLDGLGADTTLQSLAADIDALGNVSASVTPDGRLKIAADPNFEFRFANDTSNALASLGINTFFTGSDSSDIHVNSMLSNNVKLFAASRGGGSADGSNALALAQVTSKKLDALGGLSLDTYYDSIVSGVAKKASAETTLSNGLKDFRDSLVNQQQQFSGVSLDEEAIRIMEYQRSYQAAARIVSTVDSLFETLLNI